MSNFLKTVVILSLVALIYVSASEHAWPQQGYNWLQQNSAPFVGPHDFSDFSWSIVSTSPLYFNPVANGKGIIFAGVSNYITAFNTSTLSILWQIPPHVRYSGYVYYGAAVTKTGSVIVAVGPNTANYIQTFLTIGSDGKLESQLDITFPGTKFFLGSQDEIIVIGLSSWTVASAKNTNVTLPGYPYAVDDEGNVYAANSTTSATTIYKVSLDNLSNILWTYNNGNSYVADITLSWDQNNILVVTTVALYNFYIISIRTDNGANDWTFNAQKADAAGQIAVSEDYIFVSYTAQYSSFYSQLTLSSDGYLLNSVSDKFGGNSLIVDSDAIVIAPAYSSAYYYTTVSSRSANGTVLSTSQFYNTCSSNSILSLFFTNSTTLWITTTCNFVVLTTL